MATLSPDGLTTKRRFLQLLLSLPVLSILSRHAVTSAEAKPDDLIEVGGWILKRRDVR
jgi:hypothetical protein